MRAIAFGIILMGAVIGLIWINVAEWRRRAAMSERARRVEDERERFQNSIW